MEMVSNSPVLYIAPEMFGSNQFCRLQKQNEEMRRRLEAIGHNSDNELLISAERTRGGTWYNRNAAVPTPPIFMASTDDIGTTRARANHICAPIHYFEEQIALKKAKAPL